MAADVLGQQSTGDATTYPSPDFGWGFQMLSYLLLVSDLMTSAGAGTAAVSLTSRELAHAVAACRYFGLAELAALLGELPAAACGGDAARRLDQRYRRLVPDTRYLADAVERKRRAVPGDFEP